MMNIKRLTLQVAPWISIVLAIPIGLVVFATMARQPASDVIQDAIVSMLPGIIYVLTLGLSVFVLLRDRLGSEIVRRGLTGAFLGGLIFQLIQLVTIVPRSTLVTVDGTAYWALVFVPSLFVALPLIMVGFVFGVIWSSFFAPPTKVTSAE